MNVSTIHNLELETDDVMRCRQKSEQMSFGASRHRAANSDKITIDEKGQFYFGRCPWSVRELVRCLVGRLRGRGVKGPSLHRLLIIAAVNGECNAYLL